MVEHVLAKDETGVRFSYAAQYIEFKGVASKLLCSRWRIERFFLIKDGKTPGYVIADSPTPHNIETPFGVFFVYIKICTLL